MSWKCLRIKPLPPGQATCREKIHTQKILAFLTGSFFGISLAAALFTDLISFPRLIWGSYLTLQLFGLLEDEISLVGVMYFEKCPEKSASDTISGWQKFRASERSKLCLSVTFSSRQVFCFQHSWKIILQSSSSLNWHYSHLWLLLSAQYASTCHFWKTTHTHICKHYFVHYMNCFTYLKRFWAGASTNVHSKRVHLPLQTPALLHGRGGVSRIAVRHW